MAVAGAAYRESFRHMGTPAATVAGATAAAAAAGDGTRMPLLWAAPLAAASLQSNRQLSPVRRCTKA